MVPCIGQAVPWNFCVKGMFLINAKIIGDDGDEGGVPAFIFGYNLLIFWLQA